MLSLEAYSSHEYIAKDANGISRCFGAGPTADVAETECKKAALEYTRRRPDTGPLSKWTFHWRGVID